ncbi:MAG: hypothetical protein ACREMO_06515 [Gemmatimonadales bacterium]
MLQSTHLAAGAGPVRSRGRSTTTAIPPRFHREYARVIRILQRWEESHGMSNRGLGDAR